MRLSTLCTQETVRFQITDRGIGISADDQVRLFQSFHRGNNVNNIPGTGLGLSIVKRCVDLHSGTIDLTSEVDVGTTFIVNLPLQ
jgi:signal transduction histidine kinase